VLAVCGNSRIPTPPAASCSRRRSISSPPAFRSAEAACAKGQSAPGGSSAEIPESQKLELVAAARCMRKHGVPNYPDPTFRDGIEELGGGPGASINHDSPAFRDAARICSLLCRST